MRHQPAEPAAEREPGDTGRRDGAAGHGEAVRAGGGVELGPAHAALRGDGRSPGVDRNSLHLGEVDHHPAVGDGPAGDVVPAAAHGDLESRVAGERERADDVIGGPAADDQRRSAVDEAVVDGACLVVAGVLRGEDGSREPLLQLIEVVVVQRRAHVGPFL